MSSSSSFGFQEITRDVDDHALDRYFRCLRVDQPTSSYSCLLCNTGVHRIQYEKDADQALNCDQLRRHVRDHCSHVNSVYVCLTCGQLEVNKYKATLLYHSKRDAQCLQVQKAHAEILAETELPKELIQIVGEYLRDF